jgi:hypothetical protein
MYANPSVNNIGKEGRTKTKQKNYDKLKNQI